MQSSVQGTQQFGHTTHRHTHTHIHTHTHTHTHTRTHAHTHTHTLTHSLTHSLTHTHTHSTTVPLTLSLSLTHTLILLSTYGHNTNQRMFCQLLQQRACDRVPGKENLGNAAQQPVQQVDHQGVGRHFQGKRDPG